MGFIWVYMGFMVDISNFRSWEKPIFLQFTPQKPVRKFLNVSASGNKKRHQTICLQANSTDCNINMKTPNFTELHLGIPCIPSPPRLLPTPKEIPRLGNSKKKCRLEQACHPNIRHPRPMVPKRCNAPRKNHALWVSNIFADGIGK